MKRLIVPVMALGIVLATLLPTRAQEPTNQQPTGEEVEKQKAESKKNAYRLLDQVIDESQALRLAENRVRVQISAADLLWDHNESRARSLFSQAGDSVAEMIRTSDNNFRRPGNLAGRPTQLRQDLVLAAARHDAQLAYQLLAATRPAVPQQAAVDPRNPRAQLGSEDDLEQNLLARVATVDPKLAGQNAELMLEKGQFPRAITEVISQLQRQDQEAATKLTDKMMKLLQSTNLLSNDQAGTLALGLLSAGPRLETATTGPAQNAGANTQTQQRSSILDQSVYSDLLSTVIDSALKATPQAQNNQRAQGNPRGRGAGGAGPGGGVGLANAQTQPTEAQVEQGNARRLLAGLQALLTQIDQYLPSRAQSVRQKLTEMRMGDTSRMNLAQALGTLQQGNVNSDTLVQAAASAPPQMQSRIYQQAALRALEEGNTDRARQIATDHLPANARDTILQRIDFRDMAQKAEGARIDEIRQKLARLQSDNDRIDLLLQMATDLETTNSKLARQLLEEARQMTNRRAANYDQFEQQLKVAHAFATVEPARSFEVLDPAISQLNELLSAAALLSGFEVNIFREGELPLQGGGGLTTAVTRFGQELALLARTDFARSETLAGRFQLAEPRILARLSIVQGLLGVQSSSQPNANPLRGSRQNTNRPN